MNFIIFSFAKFLFVKKRPKSKTLFPHFYYSILIHISTIQPHKHSNKNVQITRIQYTSQLPPFTIKCLAKLLGLLNVTLMVVAGVGLAVLTHKWREFEGLGLIIGTRIVRQHFSITISKIGHDRWSGAFDQRKVEFKYARNVKFKYVFSGLLWADVFCGSQKKPVKIELYQN